MCAGRAGGRPSRARCRAIRRPRPARVRCRGSRSRGQRLGVDGAGTIAPARRRRGGRHRRADGDQDRHRTPGPQPPGSRECLPRPARLARFPGWDALRRATRCQVEDAYAIVRPGVCRGEQKVHSDKFDQTGNSASSRRRAPRRRGRPRPGCQCRDPHRRHRPDEICGSCAEGAIEVRPEVFDVLVANAGLIPQPVGVDVFHRIGSSVHQLMPPSAGARHLGNGRPADRTGRTTSPIRTDLLTRRPPHMRVPDAAAGRWRSDGSLTRSHTAPRRGPMVGQHPDCECHSLPFNGLCLGAGPEPRVTRLGIVGCPPSHRCPPPLVTHGAARMGRICKLLHPIHPPPHACGGGWTSAQTRVEPVIAPKRSSVR